MHNPPPPQAAGLHAPLLRDSSAGVKWHLRSWESLATREAGRGELGAFLVHRSFRKTEHNKYTNPLLKKKKCSKRIISLKTSSVFHNV